MPPKLLLHVCCAPCATYPLSQLQKDFEVTAYFYDPNIHPREEYEKRLSEAKKYFSNDRIHPATKLIEAEYDDDRWFALTKGLENEPEKGVRCQICYQMRLEKTAEFASQNSFDYFTAALSVSPHKDAQKINAIGEKMAEKYSVKYFPADWKKRDGFRQSVELSRTANLKRQDYCGCVYSQKR